MDALTERCEKARQRLVALSGDTNAEPTSTQAICAGFVSAPRRALGKFKIDATVCAPEDVELAGKLFAMMLVAFRNRYRHAFDQAMHRLKSQNLLPPNL